MYLPSGLIWFMAYLTFFIDLKNFNNRFMGSITFLLVFASLMHSMQKNLPKTSYFKYVDCWFLWYILNGVTMISCHIIIDNMSDSKKNTKVHIYEMRTDNTDDDDEAKKNCAIKQKQANTCAIIVFPMLTVPFNVLYFALHYL